MPRRLTHLDSADGPLARFALELRALRDAAGFEAPTVDQIAARSHIPRSTLYAALRGRRVPTRPILGALVTAWGGDPVEWLMKRTATEAELERERSRRRRVPVPAPRAAPAAPAVEPTPLPRQSGIGPTRGAAPFAAELRRLRTTAGAPSLRQISDRIRANDALPVVVGPSTLSDVFRGRRIPRWEALRSIVWALDGNEQEWRERWRDLQAVTYGIR
ncbi:helix-turn-helix domain-containing protein [Streptomyces sp. C36]|uniref:helix-turn-helix domain-containing protein n=1 Tax=Streptomyces sp. C36 TaxID=3237122 RepID=UPI0034C5EC22